MAPSLSSHFSTDRLNKYVPPTRTLFASYTFLLQNPPTHDHERLCLSQTPHRTVPHSSTNLHPPVLNSLARPLSKAVGRSLPFPHQYPFPKVTQALPSLCPSKISRPTVCRANRQNSRQFIMSRGRPVLFVLFLQAPACCVTVADATPRSSHQTGTQHPTFSPPPHLPHRPVLTAPANHPSSADPFAEADEDTGEVKQTQNYIHIRIQRTCLIPPRLLAARESRARAQPRSRSDRPSVACARVPPPSG